MAVISATPAHSHSVVTMYSGSRVDTKCAHVPDVPPLKTLLPTDASGQATATAMASASQLSQPARPAVRVGAWAGRGGEAARVMKAVRRQGAGAPTFAANEIGS